MNELLKNDLVIFLIKLTALAVLTGVFGFGGLLIYVCLRLIERLTRSKKGGI